MRKLHGVGVMGFGLLLSVAPAAAHHSFSSEFDHNKRVTIKGVVTRVEWGNPHVYVHMDAQDLKDASGKITRWYFESYPPTVLRHAGLTKEMLTKQSAGQTITAEGYRAKDGTNFFWVYKMDFSDGRSIVFSRDFNPNSRP